MESRLQPDPPNRTLSTMHSAVTYSTAPALAAIVVVPDSYETVRRTMRSLQAQTASGQMEIVVVAPANQQLALDESELSCFHSWHLVEVERVGSIGRAFAEGIRHAHAPLVALTEDHSFPDSRWAELLIAAHRQPCAAVGPSMRNGNPETMLSWADFYQAYGGWAHPTSSGVVRHLPGHNSSYKRDVLIALGDKLEVLMEAESILHRHLRARGHTLLLEAGTCTTHLNFASWSTWIPARYYTGRQFAAAWAHAWSWPRRLMSTAASPAIPWIRLWRVQKHVRNSQTRGFLIRLLPTVLAGLLVEGLGQMMGYAAGAGDSSEKVARYEFHRVDHDEGTNRGA
jgi:hypothetical protein